MEEFEEKELNRLYRPPKASHKGQNGKLLVIGGSNLFHSASMWSLEVASRIVDMVFYSSVPVNEEIVKKQKERFHDGIIVPKNKLDEYIDEADCILIGPGMERLKLTQTKTNAFLAKHPDKKWVVDGGALQTISPRLLNNKIIVTPHKREFEILKSKFSIFKSQFSINDQLIKFSNLCHEVTVVLKGETDYICQGSKIVINKTGNEGMTKGGTGDVLAGLVAALYCKNDAFLAAACGTFLNGLAGDELYDKVGPYFNASDLVRQLPATMKRIL